MQTLDNVLTMHAVWAAKIFCGSKTVEVRKAKPPTYSTGWYGIAVKDVPDAIVGIIRISDWTSKTQLEDIAMRREQTRVPDEFLRGYLGPRRVGICWIIESAIHFKTRVPFYSRGQTVKGAPSQLRQSHVHDEILNADALHNPDEASLVALYRAWTIEQRSISCFRQGKQREIYDHPRDDPSH